MTDLIEWLTAQIAEDELWALAASAPRDEGPTHPGGVHWTWAGGDNWDPIDVDPTRTYVGRGEGSEPVSLVTVEQWPLSWGGPDNTLPVNVCEADEMRTGDGGHIVRHDPARVLRDVAAHRRILERHEPAYVAQPGEQAAPCVCCEEPSPCPDVRDLASIYADRPGFDPAWAVSG